MDVTEYTLKHIIFSSWDWSQLEQEKTPSKKSSSQKKIDLFFPLRQWLNKIEINDPVLARRICKLIPAQCPFHRQIKFLGRTLITIPPLCKLNPLYEELVSLRFQALCYLAEKCDEDISDFC